MEERIEGKAGRASLVIGIIALILAFSPYIWPILLLVNWLICIAAIAGIILGLVGLFKRQQRSLLGFILCIAAVIAYFLVMADERITHAASNSTTDIVNWLMQNW